MGGFKKKRLTGNKYGAVKQTYGDYAYDSKLEAKYAFELDILIKAGEVEKWD